ncbi:MAG TPA: hypothetical protein PL124_12530 [Candidatus Cloacimonadota bacterium]|nr:hypothetical protein [Candidatus Cloacimonadota bacterium]
MSFEEFSQEMTPRVMRSDERIMGMRQYYHEIEPERIKTIWNAFLDADRKYTQADDLKAIVAAFDTFLTAMDEDWGRLSVPILAAEIKRIHVLKAEKGISETVYWEVLGRVGKSSSKNLNRMEAAVVIRQLSGVSR